MLLFLRSVFLVFCFGFKILWEIVVVDDHRTEENAGGTKCELRFFVFVGSHL